MPQDQANQGEFLMSQWAAAFRAADDDERRQMLAKGFQSEIIRPPLRLSFPYLPEGKLANVVRKPYLISGGPGGGGGVPSTSLSSGSGSGSGTSSSATTGSSPSSSFSSSGGPSSPTSSSSSSSASSSVSSAGTSSDTSGEPTCEDVAAQSCLTAFGNPLFFMMCAHHACPFTNGSGIFCECRQSVCPEPPDPCPSGEIYSQVDQYCCYTDGSLLTGKADGVCRCPF